MAVPGRTERFWLGSDDSEPGTHVQQDPKDICGKQWPDYARRRS